MSSIPRKVLTAGATVVATYAGYRVCRDYVFAKKPKDLKGKSALITGAASGLGRQLTLELARQGEVSALVLWDIQKEELEKTAELVKEINQTVKIFTKIVNLAAKEEIYSAAERCIQVLGGKAPYLVVNNAGIVSGNKGCLETPDGRIELELKINSLAHVWIAKSFIPKMVETSLGGHFVNVASFAAFISGGDLTTYSMSKKAAKGFAEGLNAEMKLKGWGDLVKVTVICPAHIETDLFSGFDSSGMTMSPSYVAKEILNAAKHNVELLVLPKQIAPVVLFTGFFEYWGLLNSPLIKDDFNLMKNWSPNQANKLYKRMGNL